MAENWTRLGELTKARREDLGLTQSQVQERGGPSPALVRTLETGRARSMSRSKRRDLERALRWRSGSVDDILAGEDAAPLGLPVETPHMRFHPDQAESGAFEVPRETRGLEPLTLFGLAVASNALSDAADDFSNGDGDAAKLVALAQKTYHAAMAVLADALGIDEREARETARKMGYIIEDIGVDGSARK